jgi:hypothetical protein
MLSPKNLLLILLIAFSILFASGLAIANSAEAVTINFQWTGRTGYSAKGAFSYDEKIAPKIILEKGSGKTNSLQSLEITFYTPSGEPMSVYKDVVNGIAKGKYFEFNFDTVTQQVFGQIDLGGELLGETYLKGTINNELSLFKVGESDFDRMIDSDSGYLAASR